MMMEFLYFPEDKAEYIPAIIALIIFTIGAVFVMYLFYRKSKQEEKYYEEKYKDAILLDKDKKDRKIDE